MKANITYDNMLRIEAETEEESKQLEEFAHRSFRHGLYHVASGFSSANGVLHIAVDEVK